MRRNSAVRRFGADQSGVAAIEAAITFPILILLFFGVVNVADYVATLNRIVTASNLTGDLVARNDGTVTSSAIDDYFTGAGLAIRPLDPDNVRMSVSAYRKSGEVMTEQWTHSSAGGDECNVDTSALSSLVSEGQDVIVSVACTNYAPPVVTFMGANILGFTSITITEQMALRPRISDTIACSGC
jgi:Flp pilus assembly protein TadG